MSLVVVLARIGEQHVAFDARDIESVVDLGEVVAVPLAPCHVAGLTALRSRVATVIDCATLFAQPSTRSARAITVGLDGHHYALRVDAVSDACEVADPVALDPATVGPAWAAIASGTIQTSEGYALLVRPALLLGNLARQSA